VNPEMVRGAHFVPFWALGASNVECGMHPLRCSGFPSFASVYNRLQIDHALFDQARRRLMLNSENWEQGGHLEKTDFATVTKV